jgi:hypothetical protein
MGGAILCDGELAGDDEARSPVHGLDYRRIGNRSVASASSLSPIKRFLVAEAPSTRFVIALHPVARGVTNADFDAIGAWIAARL